jgi:hypothetical protein
LLAPDQLTVALEFPPVALTDVGAVALGVDGTFTVKLVLAVPFGEIPFDAVITTCQAKALEF